LEYPVHAHDILVSDPCILADKATSKYYMTCSGFAAVMPDGTMKRNAIGARVSEDLIHWTEPLCVYEGSGSPAAEMHGINGKYYISGTHGKPGHMRETLIACADNPMGPFKLLSEEPYSPPGWQTIDSTLYMDLEGHPWLIYSHEWYQVSDGQFAAQPLSDDFSRTIGDPMILFRSSEAVWSDDQIWSKTDGGGVTDGCWLHRLQNGTLLMLWTTRSRTGYCLGYARSLNGDIQGPWVQCERPLYAHDGGHCNLFRRLDDNQLMMSFHVADAGPKRFCLCEMEERGNDLYIINEVTGNWFDTVGGNAKKYRSPVRPIEEPAFTRPGLYGWAAHEAAKVKYAPAAGEKAGKPETAAKSDKAAADKKKA
jgi:arabinan endo-1,5-alpha-L-arabinosidase